MKVDLYASERHYLDHLAPLWLALPDAMRGTVVVRDTLVERAGELGLPRPRGSRSEKRVALVASYMDERLVRGPSIHVEHGAGQCYDGLLNGQPAGRTRRNLVGYLAPGRLAVAAFHRSGTGAPAFAVGSARLEQLRHRRAQRDVVPVQLVVGFAWHWRQRSPIPEQGSAFDEWAGAVAGAGQRLREAGWRTVGHAHPRLMPDVEPWYRYRGFDVEPDASRLLAEVDVLVADNTSLLWEACALDVPVVLLDRSDWRRDVHHGLRFWEHADVGPRLVGASERDTVGAGALVDAIDEAALTALESWPAQARARAAGDVYVPWDPADAADIVEDLASALTEGGTMPVRHDPFRGTPRAARPRPEPSEQDLRDRIVGLYAFRGITPTSEQVEAWASMGRDELAAAVADLEQLDPAEHASLQKGADVTGSAEGEWGEPPEGAQERIAAIGVDPDRARWVLQHELARPESKQRSTVIDAANEVLGTEPA